MDVVFIERFIFQGITIKPLVRWLSIKKETTIDKQMCEEINENVRHTFIIIDISRTHNATIFYDDVEGVCALKNNLWYQ